MKRQTTKLKLKGSSAKQMLSLTALLFAVSLPAKAQNYDSFLPPEIVPLNTASNYSGTTNNAANAIAQTAQDARQSMYHSLMGTNSYPQFNGQAPLVNQSDNLYGNPLPANDMTRMASNQMGQELNPNWVNPESLNNPAAQSQTLTGRVTNTQAARPRTSGGISHLFSVLTGVGVGAYGLAGMRSPGGLYSTGLYGAGMSNYMFNNGFRF